MFIFNSIGSVETIRIAAAVCFCLSSTVIEAFKQTPLQLLLLSFIFNGNNSVETIPIAAATLEAEC